MPHNFNTMKKTILTAIILLGFTFIARSQATQICQPDTVRLYLDQENPPYNEGNDWKRGIRFDYDSSGLLYQYRESCDATEGQHFIAPIQLFSSYEYDEKHRLVKEDHSEADWGAFWGRIHNYGYQKDNLQWYSCWWYGQFLEHPYEYVDSIEYHYDAFQRLEQETVYNLGNLAKTVVYDYAELKTTKTTEGFVGDTWQQLELETRRFYEDGTLLSVETESYNNPTSLVTYTYNENGQESAVLTQVLGDFGWQNSSLLSYSYDANGHLNGALLSNWQDNEFIPTHRAIYELNEAGYPSVVTFEKWNGEEWVYGLWQHGFNIFPDEHLKRQNSILGRWGVHQVVLHYANTPMPDYDVEEHPTEQVFATLHPNPTTGQVTIMGHDLKAAVVLNALGQQVATATGEGETLQIDIANLPIGVYFVNVTDSEGRKCVRKVVKE